MRLLGGGAVAAAMTLMVAAALAASPPQPAGPEAPPVSISTPTLTVSPAQQVPAALIEAMVLAYTTNPQLLAERAHLRSVDENVPTALAGWRPQVNLQGQGGYGFGTQYFALGTGPAVGFSNARDIGVAQANITQPIFTGGKVRAQTSQAQNGVMGERARLIATEQTVFTAVVNAYVGVIQTQQVLALNVNNEQVLAKELEASNDRFRVGEITRTDVAQAEAALAQARSQRQTAEGDLQTARATYAQQIGAEAGRLIEPQPLHLPVGNERAANQLAAANNPNVVAALFDDASARDSIDVAFSALMPTMNVQAFVAQQNNVAFPNSSLSGGQVVANLNIPIYQGGSEYAAIRQARQNEQQTRKNLDNARRAAIQQATAAWETLIAARAATQSDRSAVRANTIALEGVQREALVGSRTTLDVLNAEQALLSSQVTLVRDLASLINASYNVAAAVGRLTARDLGLPVALYDETAYYKAVKDRWFGTGDYATGQPGR